MGFFWQIVVHFGASWCIPSVVMNPLFQELAFTYSDVMFLTVDVDDVKVIVLLPFTRTCFRDLCGLV